MTRTLLFLCIAALSVACKPETPGPTPEPTPAPTVAQSGLCRETEMVSGAPVSYCFEVAADGSKTPIQCPEGAALNDVPFCP